MNNDDFEDWQKLQDRVLILEAVVDAAMKLKSKREFDAQIVERNSWENLQDAIHKYRNSKY